MGVNSDGESPVFADERQAKIAELVSVRGRARIGELAKEFSVTEPTIRKDLRVLQSRGLLKRTHGGALAMQPTVERELAGRQAANPAAKEAIANACVRLVQDGDSVFLDSGTTVSAVAGAIAAKSAGLRLSTLTTSLGVADRLADVPGIDCVLLGGQLRRMDGALVGALALENLQRFTFSLAFIGVSGFSDVGISVGSLAEAAVKAEAIERARRVILALDHTKVGTTDFARISGLDVVDVVVTDTTTPAVEALCARYDIELLAADA
jgi:DeoR/GlpR family transcriptional regulator of sugar metabolism